MQCPSTTWQCSFLPHPLYPSYPLNTSWETPYHLHNGGETYLCQEPEFLATQSTPLSPILTIPSVCGIEYTYPYISRHNKERTFPSNNAKSKPSYKNLHYLVGSCTPMLSTWVTPCTVHSCVYTHIYITSVNSTTTVGKYLTHRCTLRTDLFITHGNQALNLS